MKKITFFIGFVIMFMTLNAQWSEDSKENILISPAGAGNTLVATAKTSDDMMYVSWNSNSTDFNTSLQLLDKDGKAMWKDGGILVSDHPAPTWTSGYDLCVAQDDCAIIALSDGRDYEDGNGFRPVVYKINKKGEFLWGKDGVQVPYKVKGGTMAKVCVTGEGNVVIGFTDIDGQCLALTKFSPDGAILWSGLTVSLGAKCDLTSSGADDFILTYYITGAGGTNLMAQRYNSNGDAVWGEPVMVDKTGAVDAKTEQQVFSDGADGVIAFYRVSFSSSETYVKFQRVSADGDLLMGIDGVHASEVYGMHFAGRFDVDIERGEIFILEKYNGKLAVNKFNLYGETKWDSEGVAFAEDDVWGSMTCGISHTGDGSAILVHTKDLEGAKNLLLAAKIDDKGKLVWRDVVLCDADAQRSWVVCSPFFNNQVCAFWADTKKVTDPYGNGEIYGQNVSVDGKLGVITVGVNDIKSSSEVRVYPNPAKDFISIECESATIESIELTDLTGKLIMNLQDYNGSVDVSGVNSGVYILKTRTSNGDFVNKVIVK